MKLLHVSTEDYQGALDYFGFEGKYDPANTFFLKNPEPAYTDPKTGDIFYNMQPFEGGFDKLKLMANHEKFHQKSVLSGKFKDVEIDFEIVGKEEWAAYLSNYRNQGLYRNHGLNLVNRIQIYGAQAGYIRSIQNISAQMVAFYLQNTKKVLI